MKGLKSKAIVIFVVMVPALIAMNANAQQPTAAPTPAPRNPNWCADVPASTPPLNKISPQEWADIRKRCKNAVDTDWMCMNDCGAARELWQRAKEGTPKEPFTLPPATNKLQGPFLLPGGAKGWVLPVPPGLPIPAVTATPTSPEGLVD